MTCLIIRRFGLILCLVFAGLLPTDRLAPSANAEPTDKGHKAEAKSETGLQAMSRFRVPAELKAELAADDSLLANPVSFCFDEQGRIFVAETYRKGKGIEDNRSHMDWLDDDLAAQTVADRVAYFQKRLGNKTQNYGVESERIRLLTDRDGDGKFDTSTLFAEGFNDVADGTGASVLARRGDVYFACIPSLWLLRDTNGDGQADFRQALHTGYGVRVAFHGHDLHGLCFGPDGKLYYSIGDRGYHVTTEGHTLANPDRGAVFRCNPDGSQLEVVATGLRNPQELAFDDYGNLFTGDNNSDSGDKARWVQIVEGGDSGWRMNYQYLPDRGPWNREGLWHLPSSEQPAYVLPPVAHLGDGPSGLVCYPGIGLPDRYREHFFLCDFRGGPVNSGVRSFAVKPKGAGFDLVDSEQFIWSVLATDCDFGPDGSFYLSDWIQGWDNPGKGRIYRFYDAAKANDPLAQETKRLLGEDLTRRPTAELVPLLGHVDRRVRQAAQFVLAIDDPQAIAALTDVARAATIRFSRLHAIWGLGQIGRVKPTALDVVVPLLADPDGEVRAQAAKVLGDARAQVAFNGLLALLSDPSPRVRLYAALSLGKLGNKAALQRLVTLLRENNDQDPVLRHAGVMGLVGCGEPTSLASLATDASPAVRMGVLLALARLASPQVALFLHDSDARLVEEAARAIYDTPIDAALPQLAARIEQPGLTERAWLRVLNANFRLGGQAQADAVARVATRDGLPDTVRSESLKLLADWTTPHPRDRLLGSWRPLEPRAGQIAAQAMRPLLPALLNSPETIRAPSVELAGRLGIPEAGPALFESLGANQGPATVRLAALRALVALKFARLNDAVELALHDPDAAVRAEAARVLAVGDPRRAARHFQQVLAGDGPLVERQAALGALATMPLPEVNAMLTEWMTRLAEGKVPPTLQLDVLAAAGSRDDDALRRQVASYEAARPPSDPLAAYRETLAGGDAQRGRKVFFERAEVSCVRCHRIQGTGGQVGPDLSKIGQEKTRDYLLEALVTPSKAIAKGFDSVTLVLDDGRVVSGVLRSEDAEKVQLVMVDGAVMNVAKDKIEERAAGKSAMPEDVVQKLSKQDVRDLVEYLAGLHGK